MHIFHVNLVGLTAQNGLKALLSLGFVLAAIVLRILLRALARRGLKLVLRDEAARRHQLRFWLEQGLNLTFALAVTLGLLGIWFDDPVRLATAFGLISAGLAFALQRVITAFAGYIVILRGNNFTVGDRISMGGVRGDVLALGFMQTTLMEMGIPTGGDAGPVVWVKSRQFTGRIVTVSNAKIFDEPVYNYTRDFPYIWEEISLPIGYDDDRRRAEEVMLAAARRHALDPRTITEEAERGLLRRFELRRPDFEPKVYYRLTGNWLELTVRFVFKDHGLRSVKDLMARDILAGFDEAGIVPATAAYRISGLPPVDLRERRSPGLGDGGLGDGAGSRGGRGGTVPG